MELNCFSSRKEINKSKHKSRLDWDSEFTDGLFMFAPAISFVFWLILVGLVCGTGLSWEFMHETEYLNVSGNSVYQNFSGNATLHPLMLTVVGSVQKSLLPCDSGRCPYFLGGLALSVIPIVIFLVMLRMLTKPIAWFGVACSVTVIIKLFVEISSEESYRYHMIHQLPPTYYMDYIFWNSRRDRITIYLTEIVFLTLGLICIKKADLRSMIDILKKIITAFLFFYYLIIFVVIVVVFEIVLLFFSSAIFFSLLTDDYMCYLFQFVTMYLFFFINNFAKMIISSTISTWYKTRNKANIPKTLIFENIVTVTRHMGTAAFAALPVLPIIIAFIVAVQQKMKSIKTISDRIIRIFFITYLICYGTDYTIILSSIHGQDFYQSTRTAFLLLTKKSKLSLAFIYLFYSILLIVTEITKVFAMMPILMKFHEWYFEEFSNLPVLMILPIVLLLNLIGQVCLLCVLEDEEDNDSNYGPVTVILEEYPDSSSRVWDNVEVEEE